MGRVIDRRPRFRQPLGNPAYRSTGFRQFFDRILQRGLEAYGLYYGTYRAIVVSNEDPDNAGQPDPLGRLQLRVPAVGDVEGVVRLAYPVSPSAGAGYGIKSIPRADDQVYVEFENGRIDIPLWTGGWWARGDIPDDLSSVLAHGWFTPVGHQILMVEDDGSQVIRIKHINGATIEMDNDGNISISNTSGKLVTVGAGDNEVAVLGDAWKELLEGLIDAIGALTVPTGVGPSGVPINKAQFDAIKARLSTALSQTVKVAK